MIVIPQQPAGGVGKTSTSMLCYEVLAAAGLAPVAGEVERANDRKFSELLSAIGVKADPRVDIVLPDPAALAAAPKKALYILEPLFELLAEAGAVNGVVDLAAGVAVQFLKAVAANDIASLVEDEGRHLVFLPITLSHDRTQRQRAIQLAEVTRKLFPKARIVLTLNQMPMDRDDQQEILDSLAPALAKEVAGRRVFDDRIVIETDISDMRSRLYEERHLPPAAILAMDADEIQRLTGLSRIVARGERNLFAQWYGRTTAEIARALGISLPAKAAG